MMGWADELGGTLRQILLVWQNGPRMLDPKMIEDSGKI